jgi:hypothetical protein
MSSSADSQARVKKLTNLFTLLIAVVFGGVILIGVLIYTEGQFFFGSDSNSATNGVATDSIKAEPNEIATANELYSASQANEIAADDKYKGKVLMVSGTVQSISKDFLEHGYLMLKTQDEFTDVRAELASDSSLKASILHKGSTVLVVCMGAGLVLGSPTLSRCTIQ